MQVYTQASSSKLREAVSAARALGAEVSWADLDQLALLRSAVTIGNFDGVHEGHRLLFARALELARSIEAPATALTFDPHPARFFRPDRAPRLIDATRQKLLRLAQAGFAAAVMLPFDRQLAAMTPREFARHVLHERLGARHVVVGKNFSFGNERAGTLETLVQLGRELDFEAHGIEPLGDGPRVISSSRVREAIEDGKVELAARWLKRPVALVGRVGTGAGRGRTIGIPTANLEPENELVPRIGVYAGHARLLDGTTSPRSWPTVINIGRAPTFVRDRDVKVEAHLLSYDGADLVDRELELTFVARLRPERRFSSADELVGQIRRDIAAAHARLGVDDKSAKG
jgi:riboflavin kinase/FMN adenylyltransferase